VTCVSVKESVSEKRRWNLEPCGVHKDVRMRYGSARCTCKPGLDSGPTVIAPYRVRASAAHICQAMGIETVGTGLVGTCIEVNAFPYLQSLVMWGAHRTQFSSGGSSLCAKHAAMYKEKYGKAFDFDAGAYGVPYNRFYSPLLADVEQRWHEPIGWQLRSSGSQSRLARQRG